MCNKATIRAEFERITEGLSDALEFSSTIGANSGHENVSYEQGGGRGVLGEVDFYTRYLMNSLVLRYQGIDALSVMRA